MIALTIAGSDSGGGAGIQADLKTFSALGVYGASAITAITAQNTLGVSGVNGIAAPMVAAQIEAVLSDLDVRAIKIGMVADEAVIEAIAGALEGFGGPIVLDPVMVAASGDRLIHEGAEGALRGFLLPRASLITPNLPEAAVLLGAAEATSEAEMEDQARALADLGGDGGVSVLLKGGHLEGPESVDILVTSQGVTRYRSARIATKNTHGTGCTLSSAIAAHLALGASLPEAVERGKAYLTDAIAASEQLAIGNGKGPVHHFHAMWPAPAQKVPRFA
ncbi:MAG: bifunctional hydroxymethylpyrimidine kinase/phosphomethylpyrimidine kinase [Pseudomonadota bacterium]